MSYYFSFDQYPTKQCDELLEAFMDGKLAARIDEELSKLQEEEKEVEKLPMVSQATFYENREEWIQCDKNRGLLSAVKRKKALWEDLKKKGEENAALLASTQDKKKRKQIAESFIDQFLQILNDVFFYKCTGYSESARENDYLFLGFLFKRVTGTHLDEVKEVPSTEQWKTFFQALKPDVLVSSFEEFYVWAYVRKEVQVGVKQDCMNLLVTVRDLLKTCLQQDWDLIFTTETWENDLYEKVLTERRKKSVQLLVDGGK